MLRFALLCLALAGISACSTVPKQSEQPVEPRSALPAAFQAFLGSAPAGSSVVLADRLPVMVYGQPFYAGWGLTDDAFPLARRLAYRRLTLDDLVAAALILYPRYVDPRTGTFTSPEVVVDRLQEQASSNASSQALHQPWALRQLRKLRRLVEGVDFAG